MWWSVERNAQSLPIGDVAGTLPGVVPSGRVMSAQTRHHFTTLRQVNQLIEASEAEPPPRHPRCVTVIANTSTNRQIASKLALQTNPRHSSS